MRSFQFSSRPLPRPDPFTPHGTSFRIRQTRTRESASVPSDAVFWRQRLVDVPLTLDLPFVLPGARSTGVSCATMGFETPDWLTEKINELARTEVVSVFTVMMSVWQMLMFRYSGQQEFIVGCSAPTGKGSFPFQPGLMHASVSERTSFMELLRLNARRRAESVAHDGSSLDALVATVAPGHDPERHPIFQTAVIQRQVMSDRLAPATEKGTYAPCELVCVFHAGTRAIRGRIEYPSGIIAAEASTRLGTHFLNLLRAAISLPHAPVPSLPFRATDEYVAPADPVAVTP